VDRDGIGASVSWLVPAVRETSVVHHGGNYNYSNDAANDDSDDRSSGESTRGGRRSTAAGWNRNARDSCRLESGYLNGLEEIISGKMCLQ